MDGTKVNKQLTAIIITATLIIAIVGTMFGTAYYYNGLLDGKNSEIAAMNSQMADLNSQISNLQGQIVSLNHEIAGLSGRVVNLTAGCLVTALGTREITDPGIWNPSPFNHLFIQGIVTNIGYSTAYNAGLRVVASDANGKVQVDMTVPLCSASFGTDTDKVAYTLTQYDGTTETKLGTLAATTVAHVDIEIFHKGNVTNWDVTPVWTNSQ
jgi:hypothetical protein